MPFTEKKTEPLPLSVELPYQYYKIITVPGTVASEASLLSFFKVQHIWCLFCSITSSVKMAHPFSRPYVSEKKSPKELLSPQIIFFFIEGSPVDDPTVLQNRSTMGGTNPIHIP